MPRLGVASAQGRPTGVEVKDVGAKGRPARIESKRVVDPDKEFRVELCQRERAASLRQGDLVALKRRSLRNWNGQVKDGRRREQKMRVIVKNLRRIYPGLKLLI